MDRGKMTLRPFQKETTQKIKARLAAGITKQLVQYATGLGKTPLFSSLPDELGFTKRVLVVVHREELNTQAHDKLKTWNPTRTVGIEMGSRRSHGEQLIVAGNATIGRKGSPRLLQFNPLDFDCLVIDECHHSTSQSYKTIIEHFTQNKGLLVLGVTATPNRADGTGLGEIFQEIVDVKDILYGINNGWLADLRGIRIKTGVNIGEVSNKAGDFDQHELGDTVNTPARNDLIARSWLEHAKDRQTVMFTVDIAHAKGLAQAFKGHGISAEAIWGDDPDRAFKLKCHREGSIKALMNCALLTEGYDDWRVSCIGDAAPTQSESRYTQKIGRGTRIPDGIGNLLEARAAGKLIEKNDCIILDFVDATSRHSLVTLPTLFGMSAAADLKGKAISVVTAEIAKAKLTNPYLDLTKIEDASQLQAYAVQVDLFKVTFPPEILDISPYQWHKTSDRMYFLALPGGKGVGVCTDILGKWHILGNVGDYRVKDERETFEDAIREADYKIELLGGRGIKGLISRKSRWHDDPPTKPQLMACKWNNISVPPGATKGEVALKLTAMRVEKDRLKGLTV
jgi:ATP-dependent helicase IRC3